MSICLDNEQIAFKLLVKMQKRGTLLPLIYHLKAIKMLYNLPLRFQAKDFVQWKLQISTNSCICMVKSLNFDLALFL